MAAASTHAGLNLGPLAGAPGSRVALNLGVDWAEVDPPGPAVQPLRAGGRFLWQGSRRLARVTASSWRQAESTCVAAASAWMQAAALVRADASAAWTLAGRASRDAHSPWSTQMARSYTGLAVSWQGLPRQRTSVVLPWATARLAEFGVRIAYRAAPLGAAGLVLRWRGMSSVEGGGAIAWQRPGRSSVGRVLPWGSAKPLPWIVRPPVKPPDPDPEVPGVPGSRVGLNLSCLPLAAAGLAPLNLGVAACYVVRPQRRTYVVINNLSVVRLPDREPIEVTSVSIGSSIDAWGSSYDLELADSGQLALLKPTATGPRQVEISLNGYTWTAIIESYARRREWSSSGVTLTGRSRTALLAAPYAPGRVKATSEDRSVAQLVDEELADTGFTAQYATVDWVVPAGAWFYDAAPALDAISRLAEASGAVVQSHPANKTLTVRARYPESPWHWRERTPDHVIQEDVVTNESLQMRSAPLYDAVVVTGELAGKGVTCKVRRSGEAGQMFAPQVSSPLINTAAAGAERGRNVLSDRGEQAAIDLVLPLFPGPLKPGEVGRILPLDLVEVVGEEGAWHGLCTAVRTEARAGENALVIEQTITLERHYTDAD